MLRPTVPVQHRKTSFAEKYNTRIWNEKPSNENPFIEEDLECYGYPIEDLIENVSFVDMFYLLFRGELPSDEQRSFLNRFMVACCHPGLRSEASRAAIMTGVSRTIPENVLPISLLIYGGARTGLGGLGGVMQYIKDNVSDPGNQAIAGEDDVPFLSSYYGGQDKMAQRIADWLIASDMPTPHLDWANMVVQTCAKNDGAYGWYRPGVAAAAMCDLGIEVKQAIGFMQSIAAPGLSAQGVEHVGSPLTVHPLVADDNYELLEK